MQTHEGGRSLCSSICTIGRAGSKCFGSIPVSCSVSSRLRQGVYLLGAGQLPSRASWRSTRWPSARFGYPCTCRQEGPRQGQRWGQAFVSSTFCTVLPLNSRNVSDNFLSLMLGLLTLIRRCFYLLIRNDEV